MKTNEATMPWQPRPKSSAGHFRQPVGVSIVEIASGARKYMGGGSSCEHDRIGGPSSVENHVSEKVAHSITLLTLEEEK